MVAPPTFSPQEARLTRRAVFVPFRNGNQRASSALMRVRIPFSPLMPRYYFDVRRDGATERDRDGVDLPKVAAPRAVAKVMAAIAVVDGMNPEETPDFGSLSEARAAKSSSRSTLSCGHKTRQTRLI